MWLLAALATRSFVVPSGGMADAKDIWCGVREVVCAIRRFPSRTAGALRVGRGNGAHSSTRVTRLAGAVRDASRPSAEQQRQQRGRWCNCLI